MEKAADEKFCQECGAVIKSKAEICPKCGVRQSHVAGSGVPGHRRCVECGFTGQMKNWLRGYSFPQMIAILLCLCWLVPGLVFIAWAWDKQKCPQCGKVAQNPPA